MSKDGRACWPRAAAGIQVAMQQQAEGFLEASTAGPPQAHSVRLWGPRFHDSGATRPRARTCGQQLWFKQERAPSPNLLLSLMLMGTGGSGC